VGLALVPVRGWPNGDDAGYRIAVVAPHLEPDAGGDAGARDDREELVRDGEPLRLRLGLLRKAPGAGQVDVTAAPVAPVSGHRPVVPAEVVGRGDVGKEVEAALVP